MKNRLPKRLSAWLLTLIMALSLLPAAALADEVDDDRSPPAPQEDYGYVRLVFSEGEQIDLYHGEYITERSPTAAVFGNAGEDFIANGEYAALYYEGKLYYKAALDGVRIDADAVLPAEDFALVPMGELAAQTPPSSTEPVALTVEGTTEGTTGGTTEGTTEGTTGGTNEGSTGGTTEGSTEGTNEGSTEGTTGGTNGGTTGGTTGGTNEGTNGGTTGGTNGGTNGGTTGGTNGDTTKQQETLPTPTLVRKAPQLAARGADDLYGRVQIRFENMDSTGPNDQIFLSDRQYIKVCNRYATVRTVNVEGNEFAGDEFISTDDYIAYYYSGILYLKGTFDGAFIDLQQARTPSSTKYAYVVVQDDTTMRGKPCLLYASYKHIDLRIPTGKTLTLIANHDTDIDFPGAIYTRDDNNGVTISGGGTLDIDYVGREDSTGRQKAVYGIFASEVTLEHNGTDPRYLGSPTVKINMINGDSDCNGDAVTGIDTGVLTVKDNAQLKIDVYGRALDPTKEGISYAEGATQGRVNMAIRADSMELLDSASVDIISHKNVISDICLTGEGDALTVNTTGHLNIKNEGNIDRYPKPDDGVDLLDLPDANIKVPTGASVKFEKAQEGVFIDSYARTIDQWYDKDIAGEVEDGHHWAIGGTLMLGPKMYRGDHRVGETVTVTNSSRSAIIWGSAKFIYSGQGVHTVKVSRGVGVVENNGGNPTGRVKEPEFNDIYIVRPGDQLMLTAPEGKGRFLYWYDAMSNENTEGGTKWTKQTDQYFQNIRENMLLVPVYDVMTKEPTLGPLRYMEGGEIDSNYSSHDLDFAYDGTGIDDRGGFRVYLVPAQLPKYGEVMQHVNMLDGRQCVRFKPGTLFADENHPSSGSAYNYMSIEPGKKYRIAVGDWGGGRGYWYFSEPFEFNPPVAPPYIAPKSTFFQEAGSQQVTITAERGADIQYRLWNHTTNTWDDYQDYTKPFTVNYTADQAARIEARAAGSAEGVTTKVEYAVQPTAIPTVKYGDQVLAHPGSAYPGERYYYKSMEVQVEPLEGYDIYYRVGYEPHGGSNGSEIFGTKLEEDGKVTISGTGTEQEYVYFRARKILPGSWGEWSRTSARLTLKEVTTLPVPNVTFYDGDTRVMPGEGNTVFFHEKLTAVLSTTTQWPINAEMRYSTADGPGGGTSAYTEPVKYTAAGTLWVNTRATLANGTEPSNTVKYTIQQDASHVKKTMTVATPIVGVYDINGTTINFSANSTSRIYQINVGKEIKVVGHPGTSDDKVFYKWAADPDVVVFSDPHSPTTTFTMPDSDFTLTAEYRALPTGGITQNTNIDLDAGKPAGKSLSLRSGPRDTFSEWRHLTYQWYEGDNTTTGTPLDSFDPFEIGKTYTARVTITVTEGCTFADGAAVQTKTSPSNGFISVADGKLTRAAGKSIAFDLHLLTMPELTMELAPGDPLPTATDLTAQLPGFTVTPTWQNGATTAPDSATVTLTKLEIKPVDGSYQLANCSVWINGAERTGKYGHGSSTLTLTNIPVPVKPEGVEVSGTITSYGDAGENVTVTLTKQGETAPAVTDTLTGASGTAPYSQTYSFLAVPAGTYTLKVEKKGHAPWTEEITVATDNIGKDVTVYLWGDVDLSGSVDIMDALTLLWYIDPSSGTSLSDHALAVADVDGIPGIDIMDALNVLWYVDPSMGMSKFPIE